MSKRYSSDEIQTMKLEALALGLCGPGLFFSGDPERLTEICNGCGSDAMPKIVVDALTILFEAYSSTVAIHDCRYYLSDGTEETREKADSEFYDNAKKQWAHHWGKLRWLKKASWIDLLKIRTAYKALQAFGKDAWADALREREREAKDE